MFHLQGNVKIPWSCHRSEVLKRKPQFSQERKTVKDSGSSSKAVGGGGEGDGPGLIILPPSVPFVSRLPPFSERDETLTRLTQSTHVYMCHAVSFMTYGVSDLERFPI